MAYTTIKKPSDYYNTKLYTGTGSELAITGVGFQPDWVWTKNRVDSYSHWLFDSVRGVNEGLRTDRTDGEIDNATRQVSFDSDGFTLGNSADVNVNGNTYASWNWLASNTTASNTDGSITSTVSANTTSGFSIVSYTGTGANATIGHGLGVAPKMIINKCRSAAQNWATYHSSLGGTKALFLDGTNGETTSSSYFNNTDPTSSVFSVGNSGDTNLSSGTHISYCFAEVKGFSKFGSYVGNGNADGTFVYTGFKPAFILYKNVAPVSENWEIHDTKRSESNISNKIFYANQNTAETTTDRIDILSNGFKSRTANSACNGSGNTIIYMAFAEEPLVGDNPATAR
jgi:hypothetical protein